MGCPPVPPGTEGAPAPPPATGELKGVALMVAPAGFSDTVRNPPQEVYRLRDRHRSALTRLSSTLRSLEQEVSRCAGNVSDTARRDALVQRLEDMLPELEREERAFEDMILAANEAARLF